MLFVSYRLLLPMFAATMINPIKTMTPPVGIVRNISHGKAPKLLVPSLKASSTKSEATSVTINGRNAKTTPPSTTRKAIFRRPLEVGGGGGGDCVLLYDTSQP